MKKKIIIAMFIFSICLLIGCTEFQNEALSGLKYINNKYQFGLNPPDNWDVKEPYSTSIVSFKGPTDGNYETNLQIYVRSTDSGQTINITIDGIIKHVQDTSSLNLVSNELRDVNGMHKCEVVYILENASVGGGIISIKEKIVSFEKNNQLFSIKYDAELDSYDYYISMVEDSINSLVIV
jgi:hypothetical protein